MSGMQSSQVQTGLTDRPTDQLAFLAARHVCYSSRLRDFYILSEWCAGQTDQAAVISTHIPLVLVTMQLEEAGPANMVFICIIKGLKSKQNSLFAHFDTESSSDSAKMSLSALETVPWWYKWYGGYHKVPSRKNTSPSLFHPIGDLFPPKYKVFINFRLNHSLPQPKN